MTPTEKLQAEAEQLYPDFPNKLDHNGFPYRDYSVEEVRNFQRAAHVACAEKYTTLLQKQSLIHHRAIVEKNKEIERLRELIQSLSKTPKATDA